MPPKATTEALIRLRQAEELEAMRGLVAADEFTLYQEDQPVRDPAQLDELLAAAVEPGLRRLAGLALLVA